MKKIISLTLAVAMLCSTLNWSLVFATEEMQQETVATASLVDEPAQESDDIAQVGEEEAGEVSVDLLQTKVDDTSLDGVEGEEKTTEKEEGTDTDLDLAEGEAADILDTSDDTSGEAQGETAQDPAEQPEETDDTEETNETDETEAPQENAVVTFVQSVQSILSMYSMNGASEASYIDNDGITWTNLADALSGFEIEDNNYVMQSGNYYLADDCTLELSLLINTGVTVTLNLNDNFLSIVEDNKTNLLNSEITDAILIIYGGTLTLTDTGTTNRYWDTDALAIKDGSTGGTNDFVGGAITGGSNDRNILGGGAICVSSGTFIMESGNIVGNTTFANGVLGAGVYVNNYGSFTMNGGSIIGNISGGNAGGVYVQRLGTFTMNDGVIAHNGTALTSNYAGGVYAVGTFTMNDGLIDSNFTLGGGGVSVVYAGWGNVGGIFTMNGGAITNNYATGNSGGILVGDGGTFIMNDGEISGNSTSGFGGAMGIRYDDATVTIYNGTITGNTALGGAAGIHLSTGTLNIGQGSADDAIVIYDNLVGAQQSNVYLATGTTITQVGSLEEDCEIGVTKETGTGTAALSSTSPVYAITAADTAWYSSDEGYYRILDDDAVILLNADVIPGNDQEIEYSATAYDVAKLFIFEADETYGELTYTLEPTGTGEGALNDDLLTVTKVGTFDITITSSYTVLAEPKVGTATLTIEPKTVAISDLVAIDRGPVEEDYYVALDDTVTGTIIGVINNDDVSISYTHSYGRITDEDYTDYTKYDADGNATFAVAVGGIELTGDDKDNYVIADVADTTVGININLPYIAWPAATDILYHDDLSAATLYGGKVIVWDNTAHEYVQLVGSFVWLEDECWLDAEGKATTAQVAQSNIGTYTQLVKFVEDEAANNALVSDTSYRALLAATTHEVSVNIKATSVVFTIADNDVQYTGNAQYAAVTAQESNGDTLAASDYTIRYYQFVDGAVSYVTAPTEVGTYLISGEFTTFTADGTTNSNYHHAGTQEYTGKQIGVLNIYESDATPTYTITFDGYSDLTITGAYEEGIYILPSIIDDATGAVDSAYIGWAYNGSTYEFGARFPQPASDVTLTPVAAPDTYTLSGTVYGVDLSGDQDAALNQIGIAIMQGSEIIATYETDENGYFSCELAAGYYIVVITRDQVVQNEITLHVEITDSDMELDDIILPDTAQNTTVEIASNVSVTSVNGLNKVLDWYLEQDGTKLSNTIVVNIDPIVIDGAQEEEYQKIMALAAEDGLTSDNLKVFFDVNITREYDGDITQIRTIPNGEYLEIYIPLSGIYQNKEEYRVYRYHLDEDGNVTVDYISATPNEYGEQLTLSDDGQTLLLKAKFYSVLGVAYLEKTEEASSQSSSSSSGSSTYTVAYDFNGGSGAAIETTTQSKYDMVGVKSTTIVRDGYVFTGWLNSVDGQIYQANELFVMPEQDVLFTAQWSSAYNPAGVPQTGDISHTPVLLALMGLFALGMMFTRKKQRK